MSEQLELVDGSMDGVSGFGRPVLVVEDNADLRVICKTILECRGYATICATDGREGYELARRYQPAAVVTDIMMPVMDGREMAMRLRDDPETGHIPVIAFSAARLSERDRSMAGFVACLEKPVDPARLVEVVRRVIALRFAA